MKIATNSIMGVTRDDLGFPVEVSDADALTASALQENVGRIYKYTGQTSEDIVTGALYMVVDE